MKCYWLILWVDAGLQPITQLKCRIKRNLVNTQTSCADTNRTLLYELHCKLILDNIKYNPKSCKVRKCKPTVRLC